MPKTTLKNLHTENKRKKLAPNVQAANLNQTTKVPSKREQKCDTAQGNTAAKISSVLNKLENWDILKENYSFNQELITLKEKITDLVNQRDDLIRIFTGVDQNKTLKSVSPYSLESEISDLKSTIEMLQKGLNVILDEHSTLKGLVIGRLKNIDSILELNSNQMSAKSIYNYLERPEKYLFSGPKENSGFLLPRYMSSNQSHFDICQPSSIFNYSNSHFLKSISKVDAFGATDKNDSMAKFRQIAELKIIMEILQKYSKIVTDEFKNINSDANVADINPFYSHFQTNIETDPQDHTDKFQVGTAIRYENNSKPSGYIHSTSLNHDCNLIDLTNKAELPKESVNLNRNKFKIGPKFIVDQPQVSSTVLNSNSLGKNSKDMLVNCDSVDEMSFDDCYSCKELHVEKGSNWNINDPLHRSTGTSFGGFGLDVKQSMKKNVLFLSDGQGRFCSQFLQDELGTDFSLISAVKPDGLFEEIINDFKHLASSFSLEDYVVIFAGLNNLKEKSCSYIDFEFVLPILKHTNVIFTRIPLLIDQPSLNSQIRKVNNDNSRKIFKLSKKYSNVLPMPKFTFFSKDHPKLNFNKIGKKSLCKHLAKTILTHSFNNSQKQCVESLCIKPLKPFRVSNPLKVERNKSNKYLDKATSIERKSYKSIRNKIYKMHQISNRELQDRCQQFRKSIETQTSGEHLNKWPFQMANEKLSDANYKLPIERRSTLNYRVDKANPSVQPSMMERQADVNRGVRELSENYSPEDYPDEQGFFAGIFMKNNQTNMTTIKELLGQGDIPKPRKNFIQENVKRLKELKLEKTNKLGSQRSKNLQPLTERRNAQTMVSSSRFSQRHSVSSQQSPSPPLHGRRNKHVTLDTQPALLERDDSPRGYRSQGCQTLNSKQLSSLYEEGVIRYPSVRDMGAGEGRTMKEMALQTETPVEVLHPPPQPLPPAIVPAYAPLPLSEGLHWDEEKKDKDYVRMNAAIPDPRRYKTPDPSTDPTRAPSTYQRGVVPKYLREHKKEMERERMNKAKEDECPEGHIQLPDDIKQKHLNTLKQNYADLVSQLNQLPVSTDTLRTRTRKKQIEADLDRIEAAIALFSREKVFVKADS